MLALVIGLSACSQEPSEIGPAPLGDLSALEQLAESYTKVSDQMLATSPISLPGKERRRFLENLFQDAGYDFSQTLAALAEGLDNNNKLHRELAELVMMSHTKTNYPSDPAEIYSPEELQHVAKIERALKGY